MMVPLERRGMGIPPATALKIEICTYFFLPPFLALCLALRFAFFAL